ncbi:acetate/propionate family kinase [Mycoplasma corogypsi]|uniref:acetate/propionate family kinase n=1 Tax=Mycoplasma corogypsi TaxID=2106 RepID=UPI003873C669
MESKVLVINAGSSSIKLSLFKKSDLTLIASGLAERITLPEGRVVIKHNGNIHEMFVDLENHEVAVEKIYELMQNISLVEDKSEIANIGFRVVHGGNYFFDATKLDKDAISKIEECSIYAPLHNPGAVQAILGFKKVFPKAKLSATFDTSFHTTINKINHTYPIPKQLTEKYGIKKYGAHGISHQYITEKLAKVLNKDKVTFINLHLGNGASLCAVKDSKSFDTSMGLTPLAGIMMGTRSGDIDPSIHEFIKTQAKLDVVEFTDMLNKESGLLGVSGISSDMRDLRGLAKEGNLDAEFAIELFAQKVADYTANYANKIGGKPEAIVFTAGIGENDFSIRKRIISKLFFRNIEICDQRNEADFTDYKLISTDNSEVPVYVIRTNEELLIARNAVMLDEK